MRALTMGVMSFVWLAAVPARSQAPEGALVRAEAALLQLRLEEAETLLSDLHRAHSTDPNVLRLLALQRFHRGTTRAR